MWSIRKLAAAGQLGALLAIGAALLAGCGFRPLYGAQTPADAQTLSTIDIKPIADRRGQILRNMLIDRLTPTGLPRRPAYVLSVRLTESKQELAIRKDESATRANLTVTAQFVLDALHNPELGAFSGTASSTNSYNVLQSDFATLSAENDARERALRVLAEQIRIRIAAALHNPALFSRPKERPPG